MSLDDLRKLCERHGWPMREVRAGYTISAAELEGDAEAIRAAEDEAMRTACETRGVEYDPNWREVTA